MRLVNRGQQARTVSEYVMWGLLRYFVTHSWQGVLLTSELRRVRVCDYWKVFETIFLSCKVPATCNTTEYYNAKRTKHNKQSRRLILYVEIKQAAICKLTDANVCFCFLYAQQQNIPSNCDKKLWCSYTVNKLFACFCHPTNFRFPSICSKIPATALLLHQRFYPLTLLKMRNQ